MANPVAGPAGQLPPFAAQTGQLPPALDQHKQAVADLHKYIDQDQGNAITNLLQSNEFSAAELIDAFFYAINNNKPTALQNIMLHENFRSTIVDALYEAEFEGELDDYCDYLAYQLLHSYDLDKKELFEAVVKILEVLSDSEIGVSLKYIVHVIACFDDTHHITITGEEAFTEQNAVDMAKTTYPKTFTAISPHRQTVVQLNTYIESDQGSEISTLLQQNRALQDKLKQLNVHDLDNAFCHAIHQKKGRALQSMVEYFNDEGLLDAGCIAKNLMTNFTKDQVMDDIEALLQSSEITPAVKKELEAIAHAVASYRPDGSNLSAVKLIQGTLDTAIASNHKEFALAILKNDSNLLFLVENLELILQKDLPENDKLDYARAILCNAAFTLNHLLELESAQEKEEMQQRSRYTRSQCHHIDYRNIFFDAVTEALQQPLLFRNDDTAEAPLACLNAFVDEVDSNGGISSEFESSVGSLLIAVFTFALQVNEAIAKKISSTIITLQQNLSENEAFTEKEIRDVFSLLITKRHNNIFSTMAIDIFSHMLAEFLEAEFLEPADLDKLLQEAAHAGNTDAIKALPFAGISDEGLEKACLEIFGGGDPKEVSQAIVDKASKEQVAFLVQTMDGFEFSRDYPKVKEQISAALQRRANKEHPRSSAH